MSAAAHREYSEKPVVQIHAIGFEPFIDAEIHLTAAEARQLAGQLAQAATFVEATS